MNDSSRSPGPSAFLLPAGTDAVQLATLFGNEPHCQVGGREAFGVTFFDSFDWRLHAAGCRLMQVAMPQQTLLRLQPVAGGGSRIATVAFDDTPAWPADLPDGALKDELARLLDMRVLLPVVTVRGRATELRVLNEDAKTVVRLQLLDLKCVSPTVAEPRGLLPRVRLLPVRGYKAELTTVAARFADEMQWPAAPDCLLDEATAAVGREPGDYSSRLRIRLHARQMAVGALRAILLNLLDTIERNVPGTQANLDSEFLHDLRVATRRTRAALSQVKRVFPDAVVEEYRRRFAWLGNITGPTRDLDVFLLELPRYRASLPAGMSGGLDALEVHLRAVHKFEQDRLRRRLGTSEMRSLVADWRALLEAETLPGEPGWLADLPIGRVASERIWRMYRRVLKVGRAITPDAPPAAMHELRKDCKRLRYLIEFLCSIYPNKPVKSVVRTLKDLLNILGAYQDLEVQANRLQAFARELADSEQDSLRAELAIGALVADLLRQQQEAHARFADSFATFNSAANKRHFRRLFKE